MQPADEPQLVEPRRAAMEVEVAVLRRSRARPRASCYERRMWEGAWFVESDACTVLMCVLSVGRTLYWLYVERANNNKIADAHAAIR